MSMEWTYSALFAITACLVLCHNLQFVGAAELVGSNEHEESEIRPIGGEEKQKYYKFADLFPDEDDKPQSFIIMVGIKFSDGGDVWIDKDFEPKYFKGHTVYELEKVLKAVNGIDVEYVKNPELVESVKSNDSELFEKAINKGSLVKFAKDVEQALVIRHEREKDGRMITVTENMKVPSFKRTEGQKQHIRALLTDIKEFDPRWHLPKKDLHVYEGQENFDPIFDGHIMVALSVPDGLDQNGNEKLKEIVRYHFNATGLNLFIKGEKEQNFVMESAVPEQKFVQKEVAVKRKRGDYLKAEFEPRLRSRKFRLKELNEIAFNVVGGRKWGGEFKCRNFAYEFVQAIVDEKHLKRLEKHEAWPRIQRILNGLIMWQDGDRDAFKKSVPYYYKHPNSKTTMEDSNKH